MKKEIKKELLDFCHQFVQVKQHNLQAAIADAQNSLGSETQSTAGDKHDTSRAMMHLELEKKGQQLAEIDKLKRVLNQINPDQWQKKVGLGSVIVTDKGTFFMAINAGKAKLQDEDVTIISLASPLGQQLKQTEINGKITLMGNTYTVLEIH